MKLTSIFQDIPLLPHNENKLPSIAYDQPGTRNLTPPHGADGNTPPTSAVELRGDVHMGSVMFIEPGYVEEQNSRV